MDITQTTPTVWIEWYRNTLDEAFRYVARDGLSCLVMRVNILERGKAMKACHNYFDTVFAAIRELHNEHTDA